MFGRDGRQRNFVGQSEEQNFKRTTDPEILPFHTGAVMGMQGSMMDARRRNGAEMAAAPTDDLNHRRRCDNELFPHYDGTVMGMQNSYAEMSHRAPGRQTHLHGSATVVTDNLNVEPSPARRPADHEIFFQAAKPVHPYSLEGEATRWCATRADETVHECSKPENSTCMIFIVTQAQPSHLLSTVR
eukprot:3518743-Pleurochrysis_carterae.AAC.3